MPHIPRLFRVLALIAVSAASARGQEAPSAPAPPRTPPPRRTVATINPFAALAEFFTGDVETRLSQSTTLGVGGTVARSYGVNDGSDLTAYRAMDVKFRYYPSERALQGLSVTGMVGVVHAGGRSGSFSYSYTTPDGTVVTEFGPNQGRAPGSTRGSAGTELSYQWLIGPSRRFVAVAGVGAKRLFGSYSAFDALDTQVLGTARLNIGIAF